MYLALPEAYHLAGSILPIPPYNGPDQRFSYLQSVIEELNSGHSRELAPVVIMVINGARTLQSIN